MFFSYKQTLALNVIKKQKEIKQKEIKTDRLRLEIFSR